MSLKHISHTIRKFRSYRFQIYIYEINYIADLFKEGEKKSSHILYFLAVDATPTCKTPALEWLSRGDNTLQGVWINKAPSQDKQSPCCKSMRGPLASFHTHLISIQMRQAVEGLCYTFGQFTTTNNKHF